MYLIAIPQHERQHNNSDQHNKYIKALTTLYKFHVKLIGRFHMTVIRKQLVFGKNRSTQRTTTGSIFIIFNERMYTLLVENVLTYGRF